MLGHAQIINFFSLFWRHNLYFLFLIFSYKSICLKCRWSELILLFSSFFSWWNHIQRSLMTKIGNIFLRPTLSTSDSHRKQQEKQWKQNHESGHLLFHEFLLFSAKKSNKGLLNWLMMVDVLSAQVGNCYKSLAFVNTASFPTRFFFPTRFENNTWSYIK